MTRKGISYSWFRGRLISPLLAPWRGLALLLVFYHLWIAGLLSKASFSHTVRLSRHAMLEVSGGRVWFFSTLFYIFNSILEIFNIYVIDTSIQDGGVRCCRLHFPMILFQEKYSKLLISKMLQKEFTKKLMYLEQLKTKIDIKYNSIFNAIKQWINKYEKCTCINENHFESKDLLCKTMSSKISVLMSKSVPQIVFINTLLLMLMILLIKWFAWLCIINNITDCLFYILYTCPEISSPWQHMLIYHPTNLTRYWT